jgi:Ca2+-binding EF-hand superfamily protein
LLITSRLLAASLALCGTAPGAQVDVLGRAPAPRPPAADAAAGGGWIALSVHSPMTSRAAFAACDRNADDRLSIFEVRAALDLGGDAQDTQAFRRLDRDSDGYLDWSEFDLRFRQTIERALPLRVHPQRPLRLNPEVDRAREAERLRGRAVLRLLDSDGDGAVLASEADRALRQTETAAAERFAKLDADGSGAIDIDEIAPFAAWLHARARPPVKPPANADRLPESFAAVDHDQDAVIGAAELDDALRSIHPSLGRWTSKILDDADRTHNRTLGRAEILAAESSRAAQND